jgi:hypothetical protein
MAFAFLLLRPVLAQSGNQWRIDFYNNPNWAGAPVYTQFNYQASSNWGTGSPGPNVPADNFTARFTTTAFFYSGVYRFTVTADDEFVLIIDGVTYMDTRGAGLSGKQMVVDVPMTQGYHNIQIDYREFTGNAYIFVDWSLLGAPPATPVPPTAPNTPVNSATSVQTRYGDYTPCIQQRIHQVNCFHSDGAWDSPNEGSIQMEPQIVVWGNCTANTVQTMQLYVNQPPQSAACSKTEAGWFPR